MRKRFSESEIINATSSLIPHIFPVVWLDSQERNLLAFPQSCRRGCAVQVKHPESICVGRPSAGTVRQGSRIIIEAMTSALQEQRSEIGSLR